MSNGCVNPIGIAPDLSFLLYKNKSSFAMLFCIGLLLLYCTKLEFVNKYLGNNIREHSNGETTIKYFYDNLQENGLYLLDEPENSLSPKRQLELAEVIYEHVNHLGCQMIISTHSPFMLAIKGALIYDLDNNVKVSKWTELEGVRAYYDFFMEHEGEFS